MKKILVMKTNTYVIALVCLTLLSGCKYFNDFNYFQKTSTEKRMITAQTFKMIVGVQWILEKMTVDGEAFELTGEKPFIRIDDDKKISGFGSINRFFGTVQIADNGQVSWPSPMGSTQMAGPPELMKQEAAFMKALPKTERLSKSGVRLYATSNDGKTELVFYVPVE